MVKKYYVDRLSYYKDKSLLQFHKSVEDLFTHNGDSLKRVKDLAGGVALFIQKVDPFIQTHTKVVCPDCEKVCCVNKHAYHEHEDIVYLYALGERLPLYERDRDDSEPCQYLGDQGCTVSRILRPYRCTWYFCTPLLEHMQEASAPDYRKFIASLEQITKKEKRC
jgi:hypothetical protein